MQFNQAALSLIIASLAGPFVVSAFTVPTTTTFLNKAAFICQEVSSTSLNLIPISSGSHVSGCSCPACTTSKCNCPSCAGTHPSNCACPTCTTAHSTSRHTSGCSCPSCSSTSLRMSTEEAAEEPSTAETPTEVPAEVTAMDGVDSSEEAHNTDRPARASGTSKHKEKGAKGTPLADLVLGSMVDGRIKTVTNYGAFVDIGAATDGLLHVSRLSVDFVSNVEDVVKAGQEVKVRVVSVDADKNQVALSMLSEEEEEKAKSAKGGGSEDGGKRKARPQRSQGDRRSQVATMKAVADAQHDVDKFIEGEVVSMLDFGAFVRFDAGQLAESITGELDGLVHISALMAGRASSVADVVKVGQKVQIRVKGIDVDGGKVALSMITDEQEQENRPKRGGGGGGNRGRQMFSENEMGAKDWKESLQKFQEEQAVTFSNAPLVQQKRK